MGVSKNTKGEHVFPHCRNCQEVIFMEILWETRKMVLTPEEVVERINKIVEEWAAEEKAETEQKDKEGFEQDDSVAR